MFRQLKVLVPVLVIGMMASGFAVQAFDLGKNPMNFHANIHEIDFRVKGTSCVACLMRIKEHIKELKGVLNAKISMYSPYQGAVIYDANKIKPSAMEKNLVKSERDVEFANRVDHEITEIPENIILKSPNGSQDSE